MNELNQIKEIVEIEFDFQLSDKSRKREVVNGKKAFSYFARKLTNHSFPKIAEFMDCNHTTIIHHVSNENYSAKSMITVDKFFASKIDKCEKKLQSLL